MTILLQMCVSVTCLVTVYYLAKTQRRRTLARANGCQPPKKYPHKDPFLGLDLFLQTGKLFEEIRYLPELVRRYNEYGPTFEINSLGSSNINSIAPENLQSVWSSNFKDWGVQPVRLPAQDPFCGSGFITTDGPVWEHSRALLKPSFNKSNMTDLSALEKYLRMVIDQIPRDGSTVDLQPLLFSLYLDTATLWLFGESTESLSGGTSNDAQTFLEAFNFAMYGSGFRIALGPFRFLFRDSRWPGSCKKTHEFAEKYVTKALNYRRKLLSNNGDLARKSSDKQRRHILLYAMAEQTEDQTELRNQILQALMAAQETTAVLISNVFFLLSRHPLVWQQLRTEVLALGERALDIDVLQKMGYLRNVIHEVLRLYPVFPQMNRVALVDTTLPVGGGPDGASPIHIPAGTGFDTSFYVLHRLSSVWGPDVKLFNPDRWNTFKPGAWEYVPFGGGPRACAGQFKALTEASYVIVRILQEFRQIESRDEREWTGKVQLTAKNVNGCRVALTPA